MLFIHSLLLFALNIAQIMADVSISKPTSDQTYTVSDEVAVVPLEWIESSSSPLLTDISGYTFVICTGPNGNINGLETISTVTASEVNGYSIDLSIPSTVGADGSYFIQVYATVEEGGHSIHYSKRFTLSGMTGSITPSGSGDPPDAEVDLGTESTLNEAAKSSSFLMYYTSQTGLTRYAPMQTQPGSKVTAMTWSRRYPTSDVSYYSAIKTSLLSQYSTVTPGWSYTISSAPNYATPAPFPSENGGWYEPSSRLRPVSKLSVSASA